MIKLSEILHTIKNENSEGYTPTDNWSISHVDQLTDMGFKAGGIYEMVLENPKMIVKHKKNTGFILDDKSKGKIHAFPTFKQLFSYFEKYDQQWENSPYK